MSLIFKIDNDCNGDGPDVSLTSGFLILYADDILLYRPIHSQHDFDLLQQDIDALQTWCSQNVMKFNVSKCKYMIISRNIININQK